MPQFTVRQGRRYWAEITLGFIERLAGNDRVAQEFSKVGFSEVEVRGAGRRREATGLWPLADATAEIPARITDIRELPEGQQMA
jgi:hypothetical protein